MTDTELREKLHVLVDTASNEEVVALYLILEREIEGNVIKLEDEARLVEINKRILQLKAEINEPINWEEVSLTTQKYLQKSRA